MAEEIQLQDGWTLEERPSGVWWMSAPDGACMRLGITFGQKIAAALSSRDEEIRRLRGALASLPERERVAWLEARVAQQDEEIRRKDEQIAALQEVASAFISASITGTREGGWIVRHRCDECDGVWMPGELEYHRDGCVIAKARALGALKETTHAQD